MTAVKCQPGSYCPPLAERIAGSLTQKGLLGIVSCDRLLLKTGQMSHFGLAYRADPKDGGLILNFCPWCGEKIFDHSGELEREDFGHPGELKGPSVKESIPDPN